MRFNQFGQTGLFVSELCLGTMTFGGSEGMWGLIGRLEQDVATGLVRTAVDAGINFIDTANVYANGVSEEMTGRAIRDLGLSRSSLILATKVLGAMGDGINDRGASRHHIMDQAKASLKRLGTDYIDLYQLHGWDSVTPVEETLRAMDDLVRQGHVRYIGVSNWAAWQVAKANGIAARLNQTRFDSVQAYYSLAGRDLEREVVPMLQSENMGLMVWSPLAGGLLSGKYSHDGQGEDEGAKNGRLTRFDFPPVNRPRAFDIIDAMRPMAQSRDVSVAQIAIAWLLHQRPVTSVIVGANKAEQLVDNIGATTVMLTAEELAMLNGLSALTPEYPGWMIDRQSQHRHANGNEPPRVG